MIVAVSAFFVPVIGYFVSVTWSSFVTRLLGSTPDPRLRRLVATFYLGLPIFIWITYVRLDFDDLRQWWSVAPITVSLLGLFFLAIVPVVLIWQIIAIWRSEDAVKSFGRGDDS